VRALGQAGVGPRNPPLPGRQLVGAPGLVACGSAYCAGARLRVPDFGLPLWAWRAMAETHLLQP
jgi:hypothetical protein